MKLSMRRFVPWGLGFLLAGLVAHGGCASTEVSTPFPDSGNPGLPDGGDPGRLDGGDPRQKLTVQIDPAKATIARKGTLQVKVTILIGGKSAAVTLSAPAGSGLTAARQVANADGQAVLEIKASDTAETKGSQKVTIVAEGFDGTTRGEATLDLEVRGTPGELDTSWGTGGYVDIGREQGASDFLLLPTGELVAAVGGAAGPLRVQRFDVRGQLITSFGDRGNCTIGPIGYQVGALTYFDREVWAGMNGPDTRIAKVDALCGAPTAPTAITFPAGRLVINEFSTIAGRLAALGGSDSEWVVAALTRESATTFSLAPWADQGYFHGAPRESAVAWVEGGAADQLFLGLPTNIAPLDVSKQPAVVRSRPLLNGSFAGIAQLSGEAVPVGIETTATETTVNFHFAGGSKATKLQFPWPIISRFGVANVARGAVVAWGVQGPSSRDVTIARFGIDGSLTPTFGSNGISTETRAPARPNLVTFVSRVVVREPHVYILVQADSGPPGLFERYVFRTWL